MSLKQHGHFATNVFVFPLFRQMLINHLYCQTWSALLSAAILMHFKMAAASSALHVWQYEWFAPHHCVEHSRGRILTSDAYTLYIYVDIHIDIHKFNCKTALVPVKAKLYLNVCVFRPHWVNYPLRLWLDYRLVWRLPDVMIGGEVMRWNVQFSKLANIGGI